MSSATHHVQSHKAPKVECSIGLMIFVSKGTTNSVCYKHIMIKVANMPVCCKFQDTAVRKNAEKKSQREDTFFQQFTKCLLDQISP